MGWNTWLTVGMVMLAIGVIVFIIGIVWYEINIRNRTAQNIWTYVLLIGGAGIGVVGCIMIAMGLIQSDNESRTKTKLVEGPVYSTATPYMQQQQMPVMYSTATPYMQQQVYSTTTPYVQQQPSVVIAEKDEEIIVGPPRPAQPTQPIIRKPPSDVVGYKEVVETPQPQPSMEFIKVKQTPATSNAIKLPPVVVDAPVIDDDPEQWT